MHAESVVSLLVSALISCWVVSVFSKTLSPVSRLACAVLMLPAALVFVNLAKCVLSAGCGGTAAVPFVAMMMFVFVSLPVAAILVGIDFWVRKRERGTADSPPTGFGSCPNCDALLRLSADECHRCKALFGGTSAWSVQSAEKRAGSLEP